MSAWTEVPSAAHGSVHDLEKSAVTATMRAQRQRTLTVLRSIPESDWERIVVPRWRLREVAAHLVTTDEGALTGRLLTAGFNRNPDEAVDKIEAWNDRQVGRWADRPIPELIRGLEKWARRMERLAGVVPNRIARKAMPGPLGKVSLVWLASLRVYDEWVHLEDVRRAYELPSDDAPDSVRPVARQLMAGIPLQSAGRFPEGGSGRVGLALGDGDVPVLGFDLGLRRYGYGVDASDALVTGPTAAVAMIAARRDAWRDVESAGPLKVEGDRAAAEAFLDALLLV